MAKSRLTLSLFLLKLIYKLICGLVNLASRNNRLVRMKIAVGTLILTLSSSLVYSQEKSNNPKTVYSKNDTLKLNISLEQDTSQIEDVVVLCYYGGPPSYKEPMFWGGEKALHEFISKNLIYPPKAIKKEIEGIVELSYVIDKDGMVKNIKVTKGLGYGCDEEAERIVSLFPKFNAGYKDRKPAKFEKTIVIEFKLPKN